LVHKQESPVNQIRSREKAWRKRQAQKSPAATSPSVKLSEGITPEEIAIRRFVNALHEDMTEEEYRRAGKLHRYDPDKEWQMRYARIGRLYRPRRTAPR
jgi:hypothetical protein